jgi:hypothetical protein
LTTQKPWIVPVPDTRSIDYLNENLGALDVELTPEDLREIDTALSAIAVCSGRTIPPQMELVDTSPRMWPVVTLLGPMMRSAGWILRSDPW